MYTVNKNITRVWGRGCCRQIMMCSDSFMSIFLHCFLYCLLKKSCKNTYNFLGKKNTRPRFQNYIDILFEARRVKNNPKSNFTIDFTLWFSKSKRGRMEMQFFLCDVEKHEMNTFFSLSWWAVKNCFWFEKLIWFFFHKKENTFSPFLTCQKHSKSTFLVKISV